MPSSASPRPRPAKTPAAARTAQRAALARIEQIHQRIRAVAPGVTRRVTATSLARDLEVSRATVFLDLETLRTQFGAPLAWDAARRTFHYTQAFELRPLLSLD